MKWFFPLMTYTVAFQYRRSYSPLNRPMFSAFFKRQTIFLPSTPSLPPMKRDAGNHMVSKYGCLVEIYIWCSMPAKNQLEYLTFNSNIKLEHPTFNFTFQYSKLIIQVKLPTFNMITRPWKLSALNSNCIHNL